MKWKTYSLRRAALVGMVMLSVSACGDTTSRWKDVCENGKGDEAVKACTSLIESGKLAGADLVKAFRNRGAARKQSGDVSGGDADIITADALAQKTGSGNQTTPAAGENAASDQATRSGDQTMPAIGENTAIDQATECVKGTGERAINACTKLIESGLLTGGDLAPIYFCRAIEYARMKQYSRAIQDFDQAITLKPDDETAFVGRGSTYSLMGQPARAIQDFDQAIALKPDSVRAFIGRGSAYGLMDQCVRATEDFDRAIALEPRYARAFLGRSVAKLQCHDLSGAKADAETAKRLIGE
jgi:tetratricopeptide (TPR) repeat protein